MGRSQPFGMWLVTHGFRPLWKPAVEEEQGGGAADLLLAPEHQRLHELHRASLGLVPPHLARLRLRCVDELARQILESLELRLLAAARKRFGLSHCRFLPFVNLTLPHLSDLLAMEQFQELPARHNAGHAGVLFREIALGNAATVWL